MTILEESHRQAARFRSALTGTEHILLSLLKEGENVAVRLLNTCGLQPQKLYMDTLAAMGQEPGLYKEDLMKKQKKKGGAPTLEQYSRDMTAWPGTASWIRLLAEKRKSAVSSRY